MDNILEANIDFILLKTGSQSQAGTFIVLHSIIHPILFQSFLISSIYSIILGAISLSAVLKIFFSIKLKSIFLATNSHTFFVKAKISIQNFSFKNCFAIAHAITREIVSLPLLLQPHL
jgi:hypothetical protein